MGPDADSDAADRTEEKRQAASRAIERVADGMVVGLGTGSTAGFAIRGLGRRIEDGLDVVGVATSYQAADRARAAGIPIAGLDDVDRVDLAIDGADQVAGGDLIKGGGAAHTREKVVGEAADRFVIVVDADKLADRLDRPIPLEVLTDARRPVSEAVEQRGGTATVRTAERKDGPLVTDNGNFVLDCSFGTIEDPAATATWLSTIPGVVEHGLFVGMADEVIIGEDDGARVESFSR